MKRKLLIATHSTFADGIKEALELITGAQEDVFCLCAYTEGLSEVEEPVKEFISNLGEDEELVVTTDVFGGSVNNEFMKYLSSQRVHLISGVNLPLLFELTHCLGADNIEEAIDCAVVTARESLKYCNPMLAAADPAAALNQNSF